MRLWWGRMSDQGPPFPSEPEQTSGDAAVPRVKQGFGAGWARSLDQDWAGRAWSSSSPSSTKPGRPPPPGQRHLKKNETSEGALPAPARGWHRTAEVPQRVPCLAPVPGLRVSTGRAVARWLGVGLVPGSALDSLRNAGEARNLPPCFGFGELLSLWMETHP